MVQKLCLPLFPGNFTARLKKIKITLELCLPLFPGNFTAKDKIVLGGTAVFTPISGELYSELEKLQFDVMLCLPLFPGNFTAMKGESSLTSCCVYPYFRGTLQHGLCNNVYVLAVFTPISGELYSQLCLPSSTVTAVFTPISGELYSKSVKFNRGLELCLPLFPGNFTA